MPRLSLLLSPLKKLLLGVDKEMETKIVMGITRRVLARLTLCVPSLSASLRFMMEKIGVEGHQVSCADCQAVLVDQQLRSAILGRERAVEKAENKP